LEKVPKSSHVNLPSLIPILGKFTSGILRAVMVRCKVVKMIRHKPFNEASNLINSPYVDWRYPVG
jgi:hypothetical protein